MSKILAKVVLIALSIGSAVTAANAQDGSKIESAVTYCVDAVHRFPADPTDVQFFRKFDAYYNAATGKIENNGMLVGDQAALYQFNKCMASQGIPLGSATSTTSPPPTDKCTGENVSTDGECWIKLSPLEKHIYVHAFDEGWLYGETVRREQSYASEGKASFSKTRYITLDKLVEYLDNLYSNVQNRMIWITDAFDLAVRADQQKRNLDEFASQGRAVYTGDLPLLISMYREHESPIIGGYLRSFVSPNKVIVSDLPDNDRMLQDTASYGGHNYSQTITMLGVSAEGGNADVDRFMGALIKVKECNTVVKITDQYKYLDYHTEEERLRTKELERMTFYPQLDVVVVYPQNYEDRSQFLNKNGNLAGIILLKRSQKVCVQLFDQKLRSPESYITLGALMTAGAKDERRYAAPGWLNSSAQSDFINLNQYLTDNHLLKSRDLDKDDPQMAWGESFSHMQWFEEYPTKEGVEKVLTVGGAAGTPSRSN
jgi:hypothetical protein